MKQLPIFDNDCDISIIEAAKILITHANLTLFDIVEVSLNEKSDSLEAQLNVQE